MAPKATARQRVGRINLAIGAVAGASALALLWGASRAEAWWLCLALGIVFSFVNNTLFSLLHEAVHGVLHPSRAVNDASGWVLAAFFPIGFAFQRVVHLGHHRRNRTDAELFDYLRPTDRVWLKRLQWYGLLTGFFWLLGPVVCALYVVLPGALEALFRGQGLLATQAGGGAMLSGFDGAPRGRIQLEILGSAAFQLAVAAALDLTLAGWLTCYGLFALNWGALQYADHAWSELDVRTGAWNLRVSPVVRWIFLNYHLHRAHHEHPTAPWTELPSLVDPAHPSPSVLGIYLRMWRGPRPLPEGAVVPTVRAHD